MIARIQGCLLGGALGDALGYPIEFVKPGSVILRRYGAAPPATLCYASRSGLDGGLVSDDTQMTLFSAEAVVRAHRDGAIDPTVHAWAAYRRWYLTQHAATRGGNSTAVVSDNGLLSDRRLHAWRAPGNTCLAALAGATAARKMPSIMSPPNDSKGCGAVMRSAPFGLVAQSRKQAFLWGKSAGVLTHGHPSGYLPAGYFAAVIYDTARGIPLEQAVAYADDILHHEPGRGELSDVLRAARDLAAAGPPTAEAIERLGRGFTGHQALAIALACALGTPGTQEGVAQALWRSVAHGGDSDSTGSLTGNLLGALHGVEALPGAWLADLELRDVIERVGSELGAIG
jgi:ADP-ribosylglycohydrolase